MSLSISFHSCIYVLYNVLDSAKLCVLNGVVLVLYANGFDLDRIVCRTHYRIISAAYAVTGTHVSK